MTLGNETISVVVPTRNSERRIGKCLDSICNQSYKPSEIIVVDGHSVDKTVEQAQKFPVKIILEDYGTVGGARQVGVEKSKGEFVALTDDDTIPDRDWLKNLIKEFNDGIVGVGGRVKYVGNGSWGKSIALCMNSLIGSGSSVQGRLYTNKRLVKSISGCNCMYLRKTLMEVGGFNVGLSVNEDTELNRRICKKGRLLYTPDATVSHLQDRGLRGFANRMYQFGYGRGKLRLWAPSCAPPLFVFLLVLSLPFTYWAFAFASIAYMFALVSMGLKFAIRMRQFKYIVLIPIVYVVEHFSYSIGFWKGLLRI